MQRGFKSLVLRQRSAVILSYQGHGAFFLSENLDFMELRALIVLVVALQSDSPPPIESTTVLGSSRLSSDLWIIVYSMDD